MENIKENHQDWLNSLKVADKVAVRISYLGKYHFVVTEITKITPSRRIYTNNKYIFTSDGREYGAGSFSIGSGHALLFPVTQKIEHAVERRLLLEHLNKAKFDALGIEDLRQMVDILSKNETSTK